MNNIIQLNKSQGFTRMDNSLMEAMAAVDLPARELRVLVAIARQTIGYQLEVKRLTADDIGRLTNMRRDVCSKAVSHLLERRILFRVGGSRGELGVSPTGEWIKYEEKAACLTETKTSHSAQIVSLRKDASETKTATCFLYTKKNNSLPSEEIVAPPSKAKKPAKTKTAKQSVSAFGLINMLAENPHNLDEQLVTDWLALRKQKKAAVSATVWAALNAELTKCQLGGVSASSAMTEALMAGWQGFKAEWIINRLKDAGRSTGQKASGPDFDDTSWRYASEDDL